MCFSPVVCYIAIEIVFSGLVSNKSFPCTKHVRFPGLPIQAVCLHVTTSQKSLVANFLQMTQLLGALCDLI